MKRQGAVTTDKNHLARRRLHWQLLAACLLSASVALQAAELPPAATPGPTELQEQLRLPLDLRLQLEEQEGLPQHEAQGPLRLSLEEAVLTALRYNRDLTVQQLAPQITGAFEAIERSAFDPVAFAELSFDQGRRQQLVEWEQSKFDTTYRGFTAETGVTKSFSTGTDLELGIAHNQRKTEGEERGSRRSSQQQSASVNLSVTQALLRGASRRANLVDLRQAELDTLASRYELRGFAASLVADVEQAYWDYVLAAQRLAIFEDSLKLAERQLNETEQRIRAGALPQAERVAARAEVARRRQELIDARANSASR